MSDKVYKLTRDKISKKCTIQDEPLIDTNGNVDIAKKSHDDHEQSLMLSDFLNSIESELTDAIEKGENVNMLKTFVLPKRLNGYCQTLVDTNTCTAEFATDLKKFLINRIMF